MERKTLTAEQYISAVIEEAKDRIKPEPSIQFNHWLHSKILEGMKVAVESVVPKQEEHKEGWCIGKESDGWETCHTCERNDYIEESEQKAKSFLGE